MVSRVPTFVSTVMYQIELVKLLYSCVPYIAFDLLDRRTRTEPIPIIISLC